MSVDANATGDVPSDYTRDPSLLFPCTAPVASISGQTRPTHSLYGGTSPKHVARTATPTIPCNTIMLIPKIENEKEQTTLTTTDEGDEEGIDKLPANDVRVV